MVLPIFSVYAGQLKDATPTLIGLAMGVYGLFQALFQIPFGSLSDHFGRKRMITIGLLIFAAGSIMAGCADNIHLMILGRALQGAGAVGSSILAMMADLTREEQRTKSMAIAGMTIGFSFALAMLIGPMLSKWLSVSMLFYLAALLGIAAIAILYIYVPTPLSTRWHRDAEPELKSFIKLLLDKDLIKLNWGIFILHAIFTATFIALPISLIQKVGLEATQQWLLYLPTLIGAFLIALICIGIAERKQQLKPYFVGSIVALAIAEILFWQASTSISIAAVALCLFFGGFSLLEAFLPSLISRTAPATRKGSAMGIYSCSQFLGIFVGGALGGWLYGKYNFVGVYIFCTTLALIWLIPALFMQTPRFLVTLMLRLSPAQQASWEHISAQMQLIPGIVEVTFIAEDGVAYLKMERATAKNPDFIRLKEQLQSDIVY